MSFIFVEERWLKCPKSYESQATLRGLLMPMCMLWYTCRILTSYNQVAAMYAVNVIIALYAMNASVLW